MSAILAMINELAEFEKAAHEVKATEAKLLATMAFPASPASPNGQSGFASCFLVIAPPEVRTATNKVDGFGTSPDASGIAGMALYNSTYSTWLASPGIHLEDLYVRPAYRRRGYATLLFRALAREALLIAGRNPTRLGWNCLKWNEAALKFYEGDIVKGQRQDDWVGVRVEGAQLEALAAGEPDLVKAAAASVVDK